MPTKIHVQNVRKSFQNDKVRLQVIEGLDFDKAAAGRERTLAEWSKRYDAKSEPKK